MEGRLFDVHAHHPSKTASGGIFACFSGFNPKTNSEVLDYCRTHGNCVFSLGLAPQEAIRAPNPQLLLDDLKEKCKIAAGDALLANKFAAIGECGLDYHWGKKEEERQLQKEIFASVISLAKSINKPLVIHSRDAEGDCIKILHEAGCKKVLMHCFGGNLEEALLASSYGFLISIPPLPSKERKKVIKGLQITSIVAETDAPYIGKTCEDAKKSVEMIAQYRGIRVEGAMGRASKNAASFFALG